MAHNLSGECGEKPATPSVNESYQTECWCIMRPDMMCGDGGTDRKTGGCTGGVKIFIVTDHSGEDSVSASGGQVGRFGDKVGDAWLKWFQPMML